MLKTAVSLEIRIATQQSQKTLLLIFSLRFLCALRVFALNPNLFQTRNQISLHSETAKTVLQGVHSLQENSLPEFYSFPFQIDCSDG